MEKESLYLAFVVLNDEARTILETKIIAKSQESARIKAIKLLEKNSLALKGKEIDVDEVDVLLLCVGQLKDREEVQKVRIVKDGE